MSDWVNNYEKQQREARNKAIAQLQDCSLRLQSQNIVKIEVTYSGGGDSGEIDGVLGYDADNKEVDIPTEVADIISDAAYALLPDGYENNDGGNGTLTVLLFENNIHIDHYQNVVEQEYESFNFPLSGEVNE